MLSLGVLDPVGGFGLLRTKLRTRSMGSGELAVAVWDFFGFASLLCGPDPVLQKTSERPGWDPIDTGSDTVDVWVVIKEKS